MLQLPHRLFVVAILAALLVTQRATLILAQTTPTPLTSPTPAPQTTPSPQVSATPAATSTPTPEGGPPLSLIFDQLDVVLDGSTIADSDWGAVDVTYTGSDELLYFNLAVDGLWEVQNAPLMSIQSAGIVQTETFNFDLGIEPGTDVRELEYAAEIGTTPLDEIPLGATRAAVGDRTYEIASGYLSRTISFAPAVPFLAPPQEAKPVVHKDFPNQESRLNECVPTAVSNSLLWLDRKHKLGIDEAKLSIDKMKEATGWHPATAGKEAGCDQGWEGKKDAAMKKAGLPIETRKVKPTDFGDVYNALAQDCDVELTTRRHAVAVIGMSGCDPTKPVDSKTKCDLVVAHDTVQGDNSQGTKSENVTFMPSSGKLGGGSTVNNAPWADKVSEFVVECPRKAK